MWEKIKAFFGNKTTKIVSWVVFALDIVCLILGGVGVADLTDGVKLVAEIVGAVAVFIAFVCERVKK